MPVWQIAAVDFIWCREQLAGGSGSVGDVDCSSIGQARRQELHKQCILCIQHSRG